LNINTRQCQLGRRIAPPVIATFELARVIMVKNKRLRVINSKPLFVSKPLSLWERVG
jgi:hypothetical protein